MRTVRHAVGALTALIVLAAAGPSRAIDWAAFQGEEYEEYAGGYWQVEADPQGRIYGLGGGFGLWLRHTPVCADYFSSLFWNRIENGIYGGLGMTLRLMPHWTVAPFAGCGGSYNYILAKDIENVEAPADPTVERGAAYWAGHAEAGVRLRFSSGTLELLARYTWSASRLDEADYGLIRLGTNIPF
jgi:hypothetical protein